MIERNCKICNRTFKVYKSAIYYGKGNYCSKLCRFKKSPWNKGKLIAIYCKVCNFKIFVQPCFINKKTCSKKCFKKFQVKQGNPLGYKKIEINCFVCKKKFYTQPYRRMKNKFCSFECYWISKKGVPTWSKGKKFFGEHLRKVRESALKGRLKQQTMKTPTSIEKILYDYLLLKGIIFEKQKSIGIYIVDAYISSLKLVLEVDGIYWHTLERVMKTDKAKNVYLKKCGFNLLRLTEKEMRDGSFKERLGGLIWL